MEEKKKKKLPSHPVAVTVARLIFYQVTWDFW
jgi:hypothetical protein